MAQEVVSNAQDFDRRVGSHLAGLQNNITNPFLILRGATNIKRLDPNPPLPQDMSPASRILRFNHEQSKTWGSNDEDFLIEAYDVGKMRIRFMTEPRDKDAYFMLTGQAMIEATLGLRDIHKRGHLIEIAMALDGVPPFVVTYSGETSEDSYFDGESPRITIAGVDPKDMQTRTTSTRLVIYPQNELVEVRSNNDELVKEADVHEIGIVPLLYKESAKTETPSLDLDGIEIGGNVVGFHILKEGKSFMPIVLPKSLSVSK